MVDFKKMLADTAKGVITKGLDLAETNKEINKGGSGGGNFLGEGFHEDCVISLELCPDSKYPTHKKVKMTISKDGKSKNAWFFLSATHVLIGDDAKWAFNNVAALYKGVFKLPIISVTGVMTINNIILLALQKGEKTLIDGMKVNVAIDYGVAPHTILVEDPNNPNSKVIKIIMKIKNKDGKWEEKFAKNSTGMADVVFDSFEAARAYGEKNFPKKFKSMPDISKYLPSALNEVDEDIINVFVEGAEIDKKREEEAKKAAEAQAQEEEPEEGEQELETVTEDDIFG